MDRVKFAITFTVFHLLASSSSVTVRNLVYEDVDEGDSSTSVTLSERETRHMASKFATKYLSQRQPDLRSLRYAQQQKQDANHRAKLRHLLQTSSGDKRKREIPIYHDGNGWFSLPPLYLAHTLSSGYQQQQTAVQKVPVFNDQVRVLNDLIGKNPTVQLAGLKNLLSTQYKPIVEKEDVPVALPLVGGQQNVLGEVENQLNQAVYAKNQEILAHARDEAAKVVQAQHQALEVAREKAQKEAEVKIEQLSGTRLYVVPDGGEEEAKDVEVPAIKEQAAIEATATPHGYASNYAFGYQIRDLGGGNDYGHKQTSDGITTKGSYHVSLPDGRRQVVKYWADATGYHAQITYDQGEDGEGLAQHPV